MSTPFQPEQPTVVDAPSFNAESDAEKLKKAMKGLGTDEDKIVKILGNRSNKQRQEIIRVYKSKYNKDLISELKSELSGDFKKLVVAIMTPVANFYASELRNATKGTGTNESVLVEVLLTLSNAELNQVKEVYKTEYHDLLQKHIKDDTSGDLQELLLVLCEGRDESGKSDETIAKKDAQDLYDAEEKKLREVFKRILTARNFKQLAVVFKILEAISGHSIETSIKRGCSGDIEDALLAIVKRTDDKIGYLAGILHDALAGSGTNEDALIRIVAPRSEIDLQIIKETYKTKYHKNLVDDIKDDTSGDFKDLLKILIQ